MPLYRIKLLIIFLAIVSKPLQYEDSIALLRSSLDQLEKIAIHKLPGAMNTTVRKTTKSPPPPVPPKPSIIHQKPTIPPKPKKMIPSNDFKTTVVQPPQTILKRSRGNSVSFADGPNLQQTAIIENDHSLNILPIEETNKKDETPIMIEEEEDDDDDDDVVIEFENSKSYILFL